MAGFKITRGQGFHVTFENGWTVSVQFGAGNYADNHRLWSEDEPKRGWESSCAEVAAWPDDGEMMRFPDGQTVQGWQTPAQVLALMADIAARSSEGEGAQ